MRTLTKAGESLVICTGAWCKYTVPNTWYQNCSNVVNPRRNPSEELAVSVAIPPSVSGIVKEYDSLLFVISLVASSIIDFIGGLLGVNFKVNWAREGAFAKAALSFAPRPTINRWSLSSYRREIVREIASWRSCGGCGMSINVILNWSQEFESLRRVEPVWRELGIGQRADAKWNKHENARKSVTNHPRWVAMVERLCEGPVSSLLHLINLLKILINGQIPAVRSWARNFGSQRSCLLRLISLEEIWPRFFILGLGRYVAETRTQWMSAGSWGQGSSTCLF